MRSYTVKLSAEEEKALLIDMISIQEWLDNVIHNKARQCIDRVVLEYSDKQPAKLSMQQKLAIVKVAKVKSAAERQAEFEPKERG
ncbi:hypothetical protein ES703_106592 [subsurface metagenome]